MLLTLIYRFPSIPLWLHASLVALLNAVSIALAVVLVCLIWPVLTQVLIGVAVTLAYAVATYPRSKAVRSCK